MCQDVWCMLVEIKIFCQVLYLSQIYFEVFNFSQMAIKFRKKIDFHEEKTLWTFWKLMESILSDTFGNGFCQYRKSFYFLNRIFSKIFLGISNFKIVYSVIEQRIKEFRTFFISNILCIFFTKINIWFKNQMSATDFFHDGFIFLVS